MCYIHSILWMKLGNLVQSPEMLQCESSKLKTATCLPYLLDHSFASVYVCTSCGYFYQHEIFNEVLLLPPLPFFHSVILLNSAQLSFPNSVCNIQLLSGKVVDVRPSFTYFDPSDRCQRYECFRNLTFMHSNLTENCPTLDCPAALQTLPMGKCCPVCMCKLPSIL